MEKPQQVKDAEAEFLVLVEKYKALGFGFNIGTRYETGFFPIEGFVAPKVDTKVIPPTEPTPGVDAPTIDAEIGQPKE